MLVSAVVGQPLVVDSLGQSKEPGINLQGLAINEGYLDAFRS
jgi:hypothetical protein